MHVHSHYSVDGLSTPMELLKTAKKKEIGFAVTEHNNADSMAVFKKMNKWFHVPLILGQEQKLWHEGDFVGELLFYFLQEPIESKDLFTAIDQAKKQDAIISVAHPYDVCRKPLFFGFRKLELVKKHLNAVEVFNARVYFNSVNKRAEQFALANNLSFAAGSDAHTAKELGNAVTVCNASSLEEFRKCLKKQKTYYDGKLSGPFVHLHSTFAQLGILKPKI